MFLGDSSTIIAIILSSSAPLFVFNEAKRDLGWTGGDVLQSLLMTCLVSFAETAMAGGEGEGRRKMAGGWREP